MKEKLLDLVACPQDHSDLRIADSHTVDDGELMDGSLVCANGHQFVVRQGVPRLLPAGHDDVAVQAPTADSFGAKWDAVRPEDWAKIARFQYEWYVERYGWGDESRLAAFLGGKKRILDAGSGLGRDVARFARLSSGEVVGIELTDDGVVAAHRAFGSIPNAHYVQADILNPPFREQQFDFVSSDQVIHHTPDAPRAFQTLARLLSQDGDMSVYVYKQKAPLREYADDYIRERTTRMSVEDCMEVSEQITELGKALSDLNAKITLDQGIPLLGIPPGEHDVQRLIYWHFLKCFWNDELGQHQSVLGNFDWYHPPYASRHTREEVLAWCEDAELTPIHLDVGESGISVRAHKLAA